MKLVVGFVGVMLMPGLALAQVPSGGGSNVPTGNTGALIQSPVPISSTLNAPYHLAKMTASSSPNICVVGDSTTTTNGANALVPNDLLYYGLTRRLREDNQGKNFTFYDYAISGQTWNTLGAESVANFPSWYFDQTLPWLAYVQALNCTSIYINMGINDQNTFAPPQAYAVLNNIVGWGTAPASWAASHAYTAGTIIEDSNSKLEIVKTAGTSGSGSHPTWPSTVGTATTDGGVTWELLSAVAYVPSIPDIVLITNKNESYAYSGWSQTVQNGTISVASYERTMATGGATPTTFSIPNLPPLGLIDIGRMFTEVANGYDPVNPVFVQNITTPTSAITSFPYTLPQTPGGDFDVTFTVSSGSSYGGGTFFQVTTGANTSVSTFIYLVPVYTGGYATVYVNNYAVGGAGTVSNTVAGVWVAGNNTVEVSAKGSHLLVQVNGVVVMDTVTARFVAPFQPYITILSPPASPSIIVNSYNVSNPRPTSQIVTPLACWGVVGGGGPSGGNGAVHDASGCINAVDMMVLDSIKFH